MSGMTRLAGACPLDADFSVLHPNQPPMRLSRRLSMKVHENKEVFGLDLLSRYS
jgi:hypothetical protein